MRKGRGAAWVFAALTPLLALTTCDGPGEDRYLVAGLLLKKTGQLREICEVRNGETTCRRMAIPVFDTLLDAQGPVIRDLVTRLDECSLFYGERTSLICPDGTRNDGIATAEVARQRAGLLVVSVAGDSVHESDLVSMGPTNQWVEPVTFCEALEAHREVLGRHEAFAAFDREAGRTVRRVCPERWREMLAARPNRPS